MRRAITATPPAPVFFVFTLHSRLPPDFSSSADPGNGLSDSAIL
jgi:hypothetical protein